MRTSQRIRNILRANEDGLTVNDISDQLGIIRENVRTALASMPDVYIDRWVYLGQGPASAVWCAVHVPEHAPRPRGQNKDERREAVRRQVAKHRERKRAEPQPTFTPQGLTQIRGPWPTHH